VFDKRINVDSAHMSLIPSHTHDLPLKYLKGKNKAYEVYEKPQQANCFNKLFKSQLIKQPFKHIRLQINNRIIDIFIDRTTCI
jgi:hypothetical protein